MRTGDTTAEDFPLRRHHRLNHAIGFFFGLGPVVFMIGPAQHPYIAMRIFGLGFGEADLSQFRCRKSNPRDGPCIDLGRPPEQRVLDDHPGVVSGDMGKLQATGDIADGEYLFVGGSQPGIHADSHIRIADSGLIQPQAMNRRPPSGGDKDVGAGNGFNLAVAISPVIVKQLTTVYDKYPLYLEAGIGASLVNDRHFAGKNIGSHYQFEDRLGFLLSLDEQENNQIALRYMHYSNGGLNSDNPGLDFLNVSYSYHF